MTERFCLRCDWTGEADGPGCPRCNAPLYRMGRSDHPTSRRPVVAPADSGRVTEHRRRAPVDDPRDQGDPLPAVAGAGRGRWAVIALALALGAAGFAFALIGGASPDAPEPLAQEQEGTRPDPPAESVSPSPEAAEPSEGTACSEGPTPQEIAPPADAVPAPTAEYRFQRTFGSTAGDAPDLVQAGRSDPAFIYDVSIDRTVLSFSGGTGLSLTPTTDVIDGTEYTIELVFRFDQLTGFRKVIDFRRGSVDDGLYLLDGCLNFFPRRQRASTAIDPRAYVHVVLTRDPTGSVRGFVDGIRQMAFHDAAGAAEVASETLRFFVDDSTTRGEYSNGSVSRIRLYDRALTESEVVALACAEHSVAPRACRPPG